MFVGVLCEFDFDVSRDECDWDGLDQAWACRPPEHLLDFDEAFSAFVSASICPHYSHVLFSSSTQHASFRISFPPCHISQFFSRTSYPEGVDVVVSTNPESTSRQSSLSSDDGSDDGDFVNLTPSIGSSRPYTPLPYPVLSHRLLSCNPISSPKFRPKLRLRDSRHATV